MIILNIDLGKDLEEDFYRRAREKKLTYLQYVEKLIKDDIKKSKKTSKSSKL